MYNRLYTPERISVLKENEIFVFGSNLAGLHAGGAARIAHANFGAIWGQGVGLQGQCYAIPTMHGGVEDIKPYVDEFISFAKSTPSKTFLVTRIGCGIAGFNDCDIAPLFADAIGFENIILPQSFVKEITKFALKENHIMKDKDRNWEILESEYVIRRPWLTARKDKVKMPNGVINNEHWVLEYPDWVNVIAITKDGEFVMEYQYRHGLRQCGYELCAGVIEDGEDPLEAGKRELFEETGYTGGVWTKYSTISANPSTTNNLTHTYVAIGVEKTSTQHLEATEDIEVVLLKPSEVKELLINGGIVQALMAAPLWRYFYEHPEL